MAFTVAIQITQGPNVGAAGDAVFGTLTDGPVVFTAVIAGTVTGYVWRLTDVPAASAITTGIKSTSSSGSFPQPDARGGYLLELTATDGVDVVVVQLVLGVKELSGRFIPPFNAPAAALRFPGPGKERGWAPPMEDWLHFLDALGGSLVFVGAARIAAPVSPAGTPATYITIEESAGSTTIDCGHSLTGDKWIAVMTGDIVASAGFNSLGFRVGYTLDGGSELVAPGASAGPYTYLDGILDQFTVITPPMTGLAAASQLRFFPQFTGGPTDSAPTDFDRLTLIILKVKA